ncbi:MAG: cell wall metabolism sensor histidine kinase WalK [Firmicutes bacterium]|nr:cell wall metabolism sensor histidine kinase WalK [Bacillota bacterium]
MFNNLRTKLTVSYLVLILAVMVLTSFFLLNILEQYYLSHQSETLIRAAKIVGEFSAGHLRTAPDVADISGLAEDFARQIGARVIITDHHRQVIGDSLRVGGLVGTLLDRDEVESALSGTIRQSVQLAQASDQWVMQVAVPVQSEGQIVGTVFISASLAPIYRVLGDIRSFLVLATILAMVLAGFLGAVFVHRITVPIASLTKATEQIARGDLSQRVLIRSRDEIGQLADQFNIMASRLQEMTRQLREFVANSSHELRTPLTSLNILVKSLREYPLEVEEREEFLADIDQELERLTRLVENLLDLTRLDRLAAEDTMHSADVVPIVAGILEMLKKRAEVKGVVLNYTLPKQSAPVFAVPHQIKQVIFNLVDNAVKYTLPGGTVTVSLTQEQEDLLMTVVDTGSGIPPEYREKVFERFYRVDKARSREQGGTGLGLAIVKEIVSRHGGKVWVDATPGGGATFVVSLPLAQQITQGETTVSKN